MAFAADDRNRLVGRGTEGDDTWATLTLPIPVTSMDSWPRALAPMEDGRFAVAGDHGGAEAGQLGERTLVQVLAQPFGRLRPTRTQHQGQVDGVDAETGAQGVGGLLSQNVGIAHSSDDIGCGSAPRRSQRSTREQRDCLCDTSLPARGQ